MENIFEKSLEEYNKLFERKTLIKGRIYLIDFLYRIIKSYDLDKQKEEAFEDLEYYNKLNLGKFELIKGWE